MAYRISPIATLIAYRRWAAGAAIERAGDRLCLFYPHKRLRQRLPAAHRIGNGEMHVTVARASVKRRLQAHGTVPEALRHPHAVFADAFGDPGLDVDLARITGDLDDIAAGDATLGSRPGMDPQLVLGVHLIQPEVVL